MRETKYVFKFYHDNIFVLIVIHNKDIYDISYPHLPSNCTNAFSTDTTFSLLTVFPIIIARSSRANNTADHARTMGHAVAHAQVVFIKG